LKKLKYRLRKISTTPRIFLIAGPSMQSSMRIAAVEKTTNAATIGRSRFHVTYFTYCIITTVADVRERSPERVTASAYECIRKGSAVMMKIPNPKPIVLCMKLAPAARRNIGIIYSIVISDDKYRNKSIKLSRRESNFPSCLIINLRISFSG
jgi:hypothetical protein